MVSIVLASQGGYPILMTSVIMPRAIRDYDVDLDRPKIGQTIDVKSESEYLSQTDSDYFGSANGDSFKTPCKYLDFEPLFLEDSKISRGYTINLASYRYGCS